MSHQLHGAMSKGGTFSSPHHPREPLPAYSCAPAAALVSLRRSVTLAATSVVCIKDSRLFWWTVQALHRILISMQGRLGLRT